MPPNVYVAWQEPKSRRWHTIAKLSRSSDRFQFQFTRGSSELGEVTKKLFNSNVADHYQSDQLIALFRNKIPPRGRSDFQQLATWLNLRGDESEFEMLGRFGLIPGTDGILVYPEPLILGDRYELEFFLHGIRHAHGSENQKHLRADVFAWCASAKENDRLSAMLDVQNEFDANAVALRAADGTAIVGYVPRFYSSDVKKILSNQQLAEGAVFQIVRNNQDAPDQLRLLCKFSSQVERDFKPLADPEHELFSSNLKIAV